MAALQAVQMAQAAANEMKPEIAKVLGWFNEYEFWHGFIPLVAELYAAGTATSARDWVAKLERLRAVGLSRATDTSESSQFYVAGGAMYDELVDTYSGSGNTSESPLMAVFTAAPADQALIIAEVKRRTEPAFQGVQRRKLVYYFSSGPHISVTNTVRAQNGRFLLRQRRHRGLVGPPSHKQPVPLPALPLQPVLVRR